MDCYVKYRLMSLRRIGLDDEKNSQSADIKILDYKVSELSKVVEEHKLEVKEIGLLIRTIQLSMHGDELDMKDIVNRLNILEKEQDKFKDLPISELKDMPHRFSKSETITNMAKWIVLLLTAGGATMFFNILTNYIIG